VVEALDQEETQAQEWVMVEDEIGYPSAVVVEEA
jgi:hypothetical protein